VSRGVGKESDRLNCFMGRRGSQDFRGALHGGTEAANSQIYQQINKNRNLNSEVVILSAASLFYRRIRDLPATSGEERLTGLRHRIFISSRRMRSGRSTREAQLSCGSPLQSPLNFASN
jgi:hypothetical protein